MEDALEAASNPVGVDGTHSTCHQAFESITPAATTSQTMIDLGPSGNVYGAANDPESQGNGVDPLPTCNDAEPAAANAAPRVKRRNNELAGILAGISDFSLPESGKRKRQRRSIYHPTFGPQHARSAGRQRTQKALKKPGSEATEDLDLDGGQPDSGMLGRAGSIPTGSGQVDQVDQADHGSMEGGAAIVALEAADIVLDDVKGGGCRSGRRKTSLGPPQPPSIAKVEQILSNPEYQSIRDPEVAEMRVSLARDVQQYLLEKAEGRAAEVVNNLHRNISMDIRQHPRLLGEEVTYSWNWKKGYPHIFGTIIAGGKLRCKCCSLDHTLIDFEIHAGSKKKYPAENLILTKYQISLMDLARLSTSNCVDRHYWACPVKTEDCNLRWHREDALVPCSFCFMTFHPGCIGYNSAEDVPDPYKCPVCCLDELQGRIRELLPCDSGEQLLLDTPGAGDEGDFKGEQPVLGMGASLKIEEHGDDIARGGAPCRGRATGAGGDVMRVGEGGVVNRDARRHNATFMRPAALAGPEPDAACPSALDSCSLSQDSMSDITPLTPSASLLVPDSQDDCAMEVDSGSAAAQSKAGVIRDPAQSKKDCKRSSHDTNDCTHAPKASAPGHVPGAGQHSALIAHGSSHPTLAAQQSCTTRGAPACDPPSIHPTAALSAAVSDTLDSLPASASTSLPELKRGRIPLPEPPLGSAPLRHPPCSPAPTPLPRPELPPPASTSCNTQGASGAGPAGSTQPMRGACPAGSTKQAGSAGAKDGSQRASHGTGGTQGGTHGRSKQASGSAKTERPKQTSCDGKHCGKKPVSASAGARAIAPQASGNGSGGDRQPPPTSPFAANQQQRHKADTHQPPTSPFAANQQQRHKADTHQPTSSTVQPSSPAYSSDRGGNPVVPASSLDIDQINPSHPQQVKQPLPRPSSPALPNAPSSQQVPTSSQASGLADRSAPQDCGPSSSPACAPPPKQHVNDLRAFPLPDKHFSQKALECLSSALENDSSIKKLAPGIYRYHKPNNRFYAINSNSKEYSEIWEFLRSGGNGSVSYQEVESRTKHQPVMDPCDPCYNNPWTKHPKLGEHKEVVAAKDLEARMLLGEYYGEILTSAEDEQRTAEDVTGATGMLHAYTFTVEWLPELSLVGDNVHSRMTAINDPTARQWCSEGCPRCKQHHERRGNAEFVHVVEKHKDGLRLWLLVVSTQEIKSSQPVLISYDDDRFFDIIAANTKQYEYFKNMQEKIHRLEHRLSLAAAQKLDMQQKLQQAEQGRQDAEAMVSIAEALKEAEGQDREAVALELEDAKQSLRTVTDSLTAERDKLVEQLWKSEERARRQEGRAKADVLKLKQELARLKDSAEEREAAARRDVAAARKLQDEAVLSRRAVERERDVAVAEKAAAQRLQASEEAARKAAERERDAAVAEQRRLGRELKQAQGRVTEVERERDVIGGENERLQKQLVQFQERMRADDAARMAVAERLKELCGDAKHKDETIAAQQQEILRLQALLAAGSQAAGTATHGNLSQHTCGVQHQQHQTAQRQRQRQTPPQPQPPPEADGVIEILD